MVAADSRYDPFISEVSSTSIQFGSRSLLFHNLQKIRWTHCSSEPEINVINLSGGLKHHKGFSIRLTLLLLFGTLDNFCTSPTEVPAIANSMAG